MFKDIMIDQVNDEAHTMKTLLRELCNLHMFPYLLLPPPPSQSGTGSTALIWAALCGKPRIVDILIKADPSGDHLNMKVG